MIQSSRVRRGWTDSQTCGWTFRKKTGRLENAHPPLYSWLQCTGNIFKKSMRNVIFWCGKLKTCLHGNSKNAKMSCTYWTRYMLCNTFILAVLVLMHPNEMMSTSICTSKLRVHFVQVCYHYCNVFVVNFYLYICPVFIGQNNFVPVYMLRLISNN